MAGFRLVHVGVAAALAAATATGLGIVRAIGAPEAGQASSFVPIVPCRLVDTRPADLVGSRSIPIIGGTSVTFLATGQNGNCTIPADATGLATNITVANPSATSYLTVFPADAPRPQASNLNWTASSPPTPNQVTVALGNGAIRVFNNAGRIDVIIDVVGYYVPSSAVPAGPQGATGATGPAGPQGPAAVGGSTGWELVAFEQEFAAGQAGANVDVKCPAGKVVVWGDGTVDFAQPNASEWVAKDSPLDSTTWRVEAGFSAADNASGATVRARAICVDGSA